ncbi:MAG: sigma-70 family RNA polymerase sigma factor [Marinilabiliaceae bacterium]|nr:sigma-70 family RNA polymerase sigma factor [Marinilabiliaceae bacterium]
MATEIRDIEKKIIESCKKGDSISQYALYNKYCRAMYNLAYRMMNNREDAEDMLQESFTEAFRNLGSFRYESTFGAWIKKIVINRCINQLRKGKKLLFTDEFEDMNAEDEGYADTDIQADLKKVFKSIEKLPDGYRLVFTLYLLEGYDHGEIAGILGISESTSKTQYLRAKKKLREQLAEEKISWIN